MRTIPVLAGAAVLLLAGQAAAQTTTTSPSTTTTLTAGAPTFESVSASIEGLTGGVGGITKARLQTSLLHNLARAKSEVDKAAQLFSAGKRRQANAQLRRASRQLIEFSHSVATGKSVDAATRASLLASAKQTRTDLQTLIKATAGH